MAENSTGGHEVQGARYKMVRRCSTHEMVQARSSEPVLKCSTTPKDNDNIFGARAVLSACVVSLRF